MTLYYSFIRPTGPCLASLLLTACVAKDPNSLGTVEDTGNEATAGDSEGSSGSTDGESATSVADSGTDTDTSEPACTDPALAPWEPAACPEELTPQLPSAGCYESCDGFGSACATGFCAEVQVNPCVCPEGADDCCAACASTQWLCVEGVPDRPCEAIVGTTFLSVDQLECGLGEDGPMLCNWRLSFEEDGDYLWMYSDVGQGGTYTCEGGVITLLEGPVIDHSYDLFAGILTWDGVDYESAP